VTIGTYEYDEDIAKSVAHIMETGDFSYGVYSSALEREISWMSSKKWGVLSNSGTSSLHVALLAAKEFYCWPDDSEIIVPAVTFVATYNAVLHAGLKPVLADVNMKTWDCDFDSIIGKVRGETVGIIAANLFGKPARLQMVRHVCNEYNLFMLEDSAEAIGAMHNGHMVGSVGDVGVYSFYMAHILTSGVGGVAVTNSGELSDLMRSYVNHGLSMENIPREFSPGYLGRNFVFDRIGHSYRITELEAAIALGNLRRLYSIVTRRQEVARKMIHGLAEVSEEIMVASIQSNETSSWQMFPVVLRNRKKHDLMEHLRESGIECRDMVPLTNQPCYEGMFDPNDYPAANFINSHGLYWGCHQNMTDDQIEYVTATVKEFFK